MTWIQFARRSGSAESSPKYWMLPQASRWMSLTAHTQRLQAGKLHSAVDRETQTVQLSSTCFIVFTWSQNVSCVQCTFQLGELSKASFQALGPSAFQCPFVLVSFAASRKRRRACSILSSPLQRFSVHSHKSPYTNV